MRCRWRWAGEFFFPRADRGRVLVDVATVIAACGEAIADIDTRGGVVREHRRLRADHEVSAHNVEGSLTPRRWSLCTELSRTW